MADESQKKKNNGCLGCLGILGAVSLGVGIYLLNQWDTSGGVTRTASVILVTLGIVMMLPAVIAVSIIIVVHYFLRKLTKGIDEGLKEAGLDIASQAKAMYSEVHTFRPAEEDDFEGLDKGWYETTMASLGGLGFRHLGDVVDETIENSNAMTTPIRVFVSTDGTTMVAIYHFQMPLMAGAGEKLLMVDVQTEYSNGMFVMTSNTAAHDLMTPPPKLVKRKLPLETGVEQLLAAHVAERALFAARHPDAMPVMISTLEEALESEKRQQAAKNEHRKEIGFVDPEEVRRIGAESGVDEDDLDQVSRHARDAAKKDGA